MERQAVTNVPKTATRNHSVQRQSAAPSSQGHHITELQRSIGNQAVQRLIDSHYIQAKLSVSSPADPLEHEADQVAETVMRMPDPRATARVRVSNQPSISRLFRKCSGCDAKASSQPLKEEEEKNKEKDVGETQVLQRLHSGSHSMLHRSATTSGRVDASAESVDDVMRSAGQPLDASTRSFMEPRFGRDFSRVRVHTDARAAESAQAVNARSYAVQGHLVFGRGEYSPGTSSGRRLLAHELAHVVQQGEAPDIQRQKAPGVESKPEPETDDRDKHEIEDLNKSPHKTTGDDLRRSFRSDRPAGEEDPTQRVDAAGESRPKILQRLANSIRPPSVARDLIQRTVTSLAAAGAAAEVGAANHFVTARAAGTVILTATTSAPGQVVNWTGGTAQPGNNLQRRVSSGAAGTFNITADTPADPGSQSVTVHVVNGRVAPAAAPATLRFSRQPGNPAGLVPFGLTDVRANNPTARIRAGLAGNQWQFRVERIDHRFLLGITGGARTTVNSAAGSPNAAPPRSHCDVITDLTPPAPGTPNGPPRVNFWSSRITLAHENAHVARFYSPPFWEAFMRTAEANIEGAASNVNVDHTVPATLSDAGVVGANAVAHQAIIDAQHAAADAAEIGTSEVAAHDQSNPMYTTLIAQIAARFRPRAPTALVAAALGPTSVQLNWTHNACNETEYRVYRRRGTGAFAQVATLPAGTITHTDTSAGLAGNTDFSYRVTAFGVAGESAPSNRVDVHTP